MGNIGNLIEDANLKGPQARIDGTSSAASRKTTSQPSTRDLPRVDNKTLNGLMRRHSNTKFEDLSPRAQRVITNHLKARSQGEAIGKAAAIGGIGVPMVALAGKTVGEILGYAFGSEE